MKPPQPPSDRLSRFRLAVQWLDAGQVEALDALLQQDPALLDFHCRQGEFYEAGYFQGATLLHHIAGNPIRGSLPANILEVARRVLERGADPNATTDEGGTVIGLLLTGRQVSEAGVSVPLIDLLKEAGATDDLNHPDVLSAPLWNCGRATAVELARRGAPLDLRHAAALGMLDQLERLYIERPELLEAALLYACGQGETDAVGWLLARGARGDVLTKTHNQHTTALHVAAGYRHGEIVRILLEHGARTDVIEPVYGGTARAWAEHSGDSEIAAMLG